MKISHDALLAHTQILRRKLHDIIAKAYKSDESPWSTEKIMSVRYFVASYPVTDVNDEPDYGSEDGRQCAERELTFRTDGCNIENLYEAFESDLRQYYNSLTDQQSKELAIGSLFRVQYNSNIYNVKIKQYDLRLLPSAQEDIIKTINFHVKHLSGFLLCTGASYHVLIGDGTIMMLEPGIGLLDDVWHAISLVNGFSYLRVTHNVKSEIVDAL